MTQTSSTDENVFWTCWRSSTSNAADLQVNGKLVNFFPVQINVSEFRQAWGNRATYELRAPLGGDTWHCAVLNSLTAEDVNALQTEPQTVAGGGTFESTTLTALGYAGLDLTDSLRADGTVMLAFEATQSAQPYAGPELVVSLDGAEVHRYTLPTSVTSVDAMYRFCSLRPAATNPSFVPEVPSLSRDVGIERKDMDVFFTHGFNVSYDEARAWGRILFKRLWHAGCNARFHMLTWEGNYNWTGDWANGFHYQHDVWQALRTGGAFKRYVEAAQPVSTKRIVVAHSLGNMVACEALKDGLHVGKFFMFNAAVATECFDGSLQDADGTVRQKYVPVEWRSYDPLSWSANWYGWFTNNVNDSRSDLGWVNRYANALNNANDVYNYYSTGDEVFNETPNPPWALSGMTESTSNYAWQKQETKKGDRSLGGTAYGGWGFHTWEIAGFDYHYTSTQAASMISDHSLTNNPVFNRGYEPMLDPDATQDEVRCALAKYVPAISGPAGGTLVLCDVINENANLNNDKYRNGWGRVASDGACFWKHSDIKDMSYSCIYELFAEIVQKGALE